jgi:sugar phosphate isomerase/epimerase
MNSKGVDGIGLEYIEAYKQAGCDYLELPLTQLMFLSRLERERVIRRVKDSGIGCASNNNFFPPSIKVAGPDVNKEKIREYAKEAIELAAALGSGIIVFGSSGARNIPTGFPRAVGLQQYAEAAALAGDMAQPYGITIVIEHLNHFESNIASSFSEGAALAEEIRHPNVGCLVDYYHFYLGNEDLAGIAARINLIKHIHFAKPLGRAVAVDPREGDYGAFFDIFLKNNYTGKVSIEGYTAQVETDFQKAVAMLKKLVAI